jgi:hypothetical protein
MQELAVENRPTVLGVYTYDYNPDLQKLPAPEWRRLPTSPMAAGLTPLLSCRDSEYNGRADSSMDPQIYPTTYA